ncbi:MAG: hypothetical protein RIR16_663, partial [Actinomycetota bacterium]
WPSYELAHLLLAFATEGTFQEVA